MGSGIALAALYADLPATLYDIQDQVLSQALHYIEQFLAKKSLSHRMEKLQITAELEALGGSSIVIEAAPEDLSLKRDLFSRLDEIIPPPGILATNTSTLSVAAIAAACEHPERVAGMHFFNPAAVMPLVEVIQADQTDPVVIGRLQVLAERMGKTAVAARDQPGFIVNRVARPFYGEALRLLGEGAADPETIDALVRSAGFAMGPFELMDLIGIDINLAAARSVYDRFFQEPRFRPHPIQASMAAAGRLGRKAGRGFYRYDSDGRPEDRPELHVPEPVGDGALWVIGGIWDRGVTQDLHKAGFQIVGSGESARAAVVLAGADQEIAPLLKRIEAELPTDRPLFCQVNDVAWSQLARYMETPSRLVGLDAAFFGQSAGTYLVGPSEMEGALRKSAEKIIESAGHAPLWFREGPGTVISRIVCLLINEAAFAVDEGLADGETIDRAMMLGANYPRGPLAWGRELGWSRVLAMLDHLDDETREPRYRAAPALRRWSRGST